MPEPPADTKEIFLSSFPRTHCSQAMLSVRLAAERRGQRNSRCATEKSSMRARHHHCYRSPVMDANTRLERLRRKQEQIAATLRTMETEVIVKKRKAVTRAKIIVGGTVVAMPAGERDALLAMILSRMTEKDRCFVNGQLA